MTELLRDHGFSHAETEPVMAVDLLHMNTDLPVSSRLTIHRVCTHEQLLQWLYVCFSECSEEIIRQCFTLYSGLHLDHHSPLRLYLGTIDGEPVATSLLFCGMEAASLRTIFTLPHYRGHGVGAAMTLAALHKARSCGYRIGLLAASSMGSALYRRIGFQAYGTFSVYYVAI
ncbi:GNAT family N-acetyltransferase [Dictyobacter aurantiacus]|uniref:N-acetyltransferase domain-containing protein n=1 Tax=Dictyobacter aurantiacus TaxID=1936993 RepID=A0A401ZQI1_9CHLR|nr:GNAT family N-acetyltransferase [Dictyobacter aurantiacus]GCE09125.1 hypothetical protein KDAU_64540 [Dictyobacter aurantiacus]